MGGVLCIYRHVEILSRHGISACVLHNRPGHRATWFSHEAQIAYRDEGAGPRAGDVLVVPEGNCGALRKTVGAPFERIVFAQSWSYIFQTLEPGETWRDWNVRCAIAVSRYIRRFLAVTMDLPSSLVPPSVDPELFRPASTRRLQIACMPRKNAGDLREIEAIFRVRFPRYRSVPFVRIDKAPHERVAEILAESAIFLATGYPEGFSLPPLEAMSCGCLVVGFSGRGGLEYMRHGKNCRVAADGDVLTAAEHLGWAVGAAEAGEDGEMREHARRTAERFAPAAQERALLRFWRRRPAEAGA